MQSTEPQPPASFTVKLGKAVRGPWIVAYGADGCNTNVGKENGVIGLTHRGGLPWVTVSVCTAHSLHLAHNDAADTGRTREVSRLVEELLKAVYNFFKYPKRAQLLKTTCDL